jgi:hypothetical protein
MTSALMDRLARGDGMELWVAEAGGAIVSSGRLEPVPGTEFAGIWGGATPPEWRRRGIYRALTAERARSALRLGKKLMNSDSTEFSRPILERAGFVKVSTTTPYTRTCRKPRRQRRWQRGPRVVMIVRCGDRLTAAARVVCSDNEREAPARVLITRVPRRKRLPAPSHGANGLRFQRLTDPVARVPGRTGVS